MSIGKKVSSVRLVVDPHCYGARTLRSTVGNDSEFETWKKNGKAFFQGQNNFLCIGLVFHRMRRLECNSINALFEIEWSFFQIE